MNQAWGHHCSLSHIRNQKHTRTRCCSSLRSHKHTYFKKQNPKRNAKEEIVCALFSSLAFFFISLSFEIFFLFFVARHEMHKHIAHTQVAASSFKIRVLCVRCCCLLCFYQFSVSNSCTCMHFEFTIIYTQLTAHSKAHTA